jgi:hypothetical protein
MSTETDLRIWAREEDHASQGRRRVSRWGIVSVLGLVALVVLARSANSRIGAGLSETPDFLLHLKGKRSSSPYKATQFISFTINTMGGIAAHGECVGRHVADDGTCYLGSFDIEEDVVHRALIVKEVLEFLREDVNKKHPVIDHGDDGKHIHAGLAL